MEEKHPSQFNYLIGPYMIGKFLAFLPIVVFLGKKIPSGSVEICGMGHLPPGPQVPWFHRLWVGRGMEPIQCSVQLEICIMHYHSCFAAMTYGNLRVGIEI